MTDGAPLRRGRVRRTGWSLLPLVRTGPAAQPQAASLRSDRQWVSGWAAHRRVGFVPGTAHYGIYRGLADLRAANRAAWADRWKGRVVASGPGVSDDDQTALDAAVFYLLSSAHTSSRSGLSIDGYSCVEYGGRMFWDADFWMARVSGAGVLCVRAFVRSFVRSLVRRVADSG